MTAPPDRWIYVAGPFRRIPPRWDGSLPRSRGAEKFNIARAVEVAREVLPDAEAHGVGVLVPHLVGQGLADKASEGYWLDLTLGLLQRLATPRRCPRCTAVAALVQRFADDAGPDCEACGGSGFAAHGGALLLSYPVADALDSSGTRGELRFAIGQGLPVYDRDGSIVSWAQWGEVGALLRGPVEHAHPPTVHDWIRARPR